MPPHIATRISRPAALHRRHRAALVLALLLAAPAAAQADAGIPLLTCAYPVLAVLLVPVVLIEALYARRVLQVDWRDALAVSAKANLASTLVGIPLALVADGALFLVARWPTQGDAAFTRNLCLALAVLSIPFYFVSVAVERWVAEHTWQPEEARRWSRGANRISYGLIVAGLLLVALVAAVVAVLPPG